MGFKNKHERLIEMSNPSMCKEEYIIYLERLLKLAEDKVKDFEMRKSKFNQPPNKDYFFTSWSEKSSVYCDKCRPIICKGGAVFSCTNHKCSVSKQTCS